MGIPVGTVLMRPLTLKTRHRLRGVGNRRPGYMNDKDSATPNSQIHMDRPIWGAGPIGALINKSPRATHHMLAKGLIKSARKVGGQWTATPAALKREFGG